MGNYQRAEIATASLMPNAKRKNGEVLKVLY